MNTSQIAKRAGVETKQVTETLTKLAITDRQFSTKETPIFIRTLIDYLGELNDQANPS